MGQGSRAGRFVRPELMGSAVRTAVATIQDCLAVGQSGFAVGLLVPDPEFPA